MTLMVAEPGRDDVAGHEPVWRNPSDELAMGLQLLRASSMTSIRLQLALARRDRRVAMSALDTLAAVDAEIEGLVDRLSGPATSTPELAALAAWLAQEKEAVTADKLNLACDVSGPGLVSPPDRLSDAVGPDARNAADSSVGEVAPDIDGAIEDLEPAPTRRWWLLASLAIAVTLAVAGVIMAFVLPHGEQLPGIAEFRQLIGLR